MQYPSPLSTYHPSLPAAAVSFIIAAVAARKQSGSKARCEQVVRASLSQCCLRRDSLCLSIIASIYTVDVDLRELNMLPASSLSTSSQSK